MRLRLVEQPDERRDAFHGNEQVAFRNRDAELLVGGKRPHEGGLYRKRQIAVAGAETPVRMQSRRGGLGHDGRLAGIGRAFDQRRARRPEHERIERAFRPHLPGGGLVGKSQGACHDGAGAGAVKVLADGIAFQQKRTARQAHSVGRFLDGENPLEKRGLRHALARLDQLVDPLVEHAVGGLAGVSQIAQGLAFVDAVIGH